MSGGLPVNPFVGLRPFRTEEALLFFGRRQQTTELVECLYRTHFLGVVGSSGCGKSSLVRAGLIPRLMAGFLIDARDRWAFTTMTPGESPLARLALGFGTTEQRLREEGASLIIERLRAEADASDKNCLLLVDQFEEIFRFAVSTDQKDEAADFVSILLALAEQREFPVFVVITMRSDFLGDCDAFYGLPEALNRSHYFVPRLTRQQRRECIEGPVRLYAQAVTPQLVDRILNDIGDEPDQLPVMEHALMRTWEQWQRSGSSGPVDFQHYAAIGGVKEALARDADSALNGLGVEDHHLAERIFQALTDTDASNRRVRRPVRMSELENVTGASRFHIDAVIERFRGSDRSFLVVQDIPGSSDVLIDISHESLIRQWPSLRQWALEEAESKRTYLDLVNAIDRNRALFHDSDLQVALDWRKRRQPTEAWASRYDPRFSEAMAFLEKSRAESEREAQEEARQERAKRWLTTGVLGISVALFLVILYFVNTTRRERETAQKAVAESKTEAKAIVDKATADVAAIVADAAAKLTEADGKVTKSDAALADAALKLQQSGDQLVRTQLDNRSLLLWSQASEILRETPENFVASGLLAVEALRADSRNQAQSRNVLMDVLKLLPPRPKRFEQVHKGGISAMAVDPTGQLLATSGEDRKVILWDLTKQVQRGTIENIEADRLAISWDRKWIAGAGNGTIAVWEMSSPPRRVALLQQADVNMLAFSPDGSRLVAAIVRQSYTRAGVVRGEALPYVQFNTATWQPSAPQSQANAHEVAFSPKGVLAMLVSQPSDPRRQAIRLSTQTDVRADTVGCHSLSSLHNEELFYAACPNGVLKISESSVARVSSLEFQDVRLNTSAAGLIIGRALPGNVIRVFRPDSGDDLFRLTEEFSALAVPPTGQWMATANREGSVVFWALDVAPVARSISYRGDIADLTFSHDERWLAVAETGGRVRIFNPANGAEIRTIDLKTEIIRPMFSPDDSFLGLLGEEAVHLIQTSDWTRIQREIKGRPEVAFAFTADSRMLLLAEAGTLHRFQLRPSVNELPPIRVSQREDVFMSRDGKWIGQMPPSVGEQVPERFRFWNAESGAAASFETIPRTLGLPSEDKDDDDNATPNWIGLFPRDASRDAALSGDRFGGEWYIDGEVGDIRIKEISSMRLVAELGSGTNWAFSRKGTWVAVVDSEEDDLILRIWPWSLDRLLDRACELLPRNLSQEEWKRFDLPKLGLGSHRDTCRRAQALK